MLFHLSAELERLWLLAGVRVGLERLEKGWDEAAEPRNSSGGAWGRAAELTSLSQGLNDRELFKAQGTTQSLGGRRTWREGRGRKDTELRTSQ